MDIYKEKLRITATFTSHNIEYGYSGNINTLIYFLGEYWPIYANIHV